MTKVSATRSAMRRMALYSGSGMSKLAGHGLSPRMSRYISKLLGSFRVDTGLGGMPSDVKSRLYRVLRGMATRRSEAASTISQYFKRPYGVPLGESERHALDTAYRDMKDLMAERIRLVQSLRDRRRRFGGIQYSVSDYDKGRLLGKAFARQYPYNTGTAINAAKSLGNVPWFTDRIHGKIIDGVVDSARAAQYFPV